MARLKLICQLSIVLYLITIICATNNNYRLTKNIIPENYKLEILSYLGVEDNFNFDGKVWIQTQCIKSTENITLHSKDLTINTNEIKVKDLTNNKTNDIKISNVQFDEKNDFLIINLEKHLNDDHKYEIFIPFNGTLDDGLAGFYRSSYNDKEKKKKTWLGVTQFEAISARRAFPCFDEPEMKATFDIIIGRKDGYRAVSNMPLLSTEPIKEHPGFYWDRFDTSVPMSTYLVAYLVSDFDYKIADPLPNNSNVTFRIWARKDALNQVDFAKLIGPQCLTFYENFFNIKYPLPKQDMVAIPDFSAGAMENWGLITYREEYLLYDPDVSSKTSQHHVASVIAHELAHQWFGNLVTMKWWTDLWLNEGFATYMASLAVENLFPQWNSLQEEAASDLLSVFSFDSLRTSHPVSVPIGDPKEIDEIFDTISYKKGSSLIRMMGLFLGENVLRKGVSNYLDEHKFNNAEQDDLWMALTREAHKQLALPTNLTLKTIMDTWTLQTGYPVINVERNYVNNTVKIEQKRFLRDVIKQKNDPEPCWWVPLSYSTKTERNFNQTIPKYWLSCPQTDYTIDNIVKSNEWIIFNNKMAGIYKVNYDKNNWKLIADTLKTEHELIPTLNRVQLISDSADLAFVGDYISYDVFFDLTKYLYKENEYLPWKAALNKFNTLTTQLKKTINYGNFKEFMKKLLEPMYEQIGSFEIPQARSDLLDSIKLQVAVVGRSCKFGVSNCVKQAQEMFNKWQNEANGTNPIAKDLRSVVYCTVLRHGSEQEWSFLWTKYLNSNVATEKNTILNSLGCTKEIWLLKRYLEWSLDDESGIRRQDSSTVFSTVARNDVGYYIAKDFFYANIEKIIAHLQPNKRRLGRYLSSISNQMTDVNHFNEFKKFIEDHQNEFSEVRKSVEQSLETVKINLQWQMRHLENLKVILKQ